MQREQKPWAVVVPVKRLAVAKSRLATSAPARRALALAMASDTVSACLASAAVGAVIVVTDEPDARAMADRLGAVAVADEPDAGLNPALRHGAHVAARRLPGAGIVTLASDLPALTGPDLDAVLQAAGAEPHAAVVADAAGGGTVVLAAAGIASFEPMFGPDSFARHVAAGATDVTPTAAARVRRDVDTLADLAAALDLGCGPATTAALARLGGIDRLSAEATSPG